VSRFFSIRASVPAGIFPGISAFFNGEGFGGGRSRALKRIRTIVTGIYPGATYGIEKYVHIVEAAWPDGSREGPTYELDVGIYRNK